MIYKGLNILSIFFSELPPSSPLWQTPLDAYPTAMCPWCLLAETVSTIGWSFPASTAAGEWTSDPTVPETNERREILEVCSSLIKQRLSPSCFHHGRAWCLLRTTTAILWPRGEARTITEKLDLSYPPTNSSYVRLFKLLLVRCSIPCSHKYLSNTSMTSLNCIIL